MSCVIKDIDCKGYSFNACCSELRATSPSQGLPIPRGISVSDAEMFTLELSLSRRIFRDIVGSKIPSLRANQQRSARRSNCSKQLKSSWFCQCQSAVKSLMTSAKFEKKKDLW